MGTSRNEGEGNKTADRNYRKATQEFVESERGQREIENAGNVSPGEEKDIRRAEEQAKQRAKDHDPAEMTRGDSGPGASESRPGSGSEQQDSSRGSRSAH
ncbi:hypothetical protein JM946_10005 [Steroidobacter sp. S1-65]|uniref:Stress-induced protein n=1 Tax=Steroidobacter gossypii TaxID=2805490 RepID=A0ABS1WVT0_9GAMM|nr:hypothetical protein [Steroidobacter gossypii]MBM0105085.1 hypothetical protein [Steroidobacter gossypii]